MLDFDYSPAAISWRHHRLVQMVTRALILWSLATIVVCGMVKHTYAHRLSSDHLNALSRILRAASMHSMRARARNVDNMETVTVAAQSLAWRCRMAILWAWARCEEAAVETLASIVSNVQSVVATLFNNVPALHRSTRQLALCPFLATRLRC